MSSISTKLTIDVEFCPMPYTLVTVPGYCNVRDAPESLNKGVYLWCIELHGSFLVNYVGKTTDRRGFAGRLTDEHHQWRNGRYWTPVDIEAFKNGQRIVLRNEYRTQDQRLRQLEEFQPLYRILLAPIAEPSHCLAVESATIYRLRDPRTFQFLTNRDKSWHRRLNSAIDVRFLPTSPIFGLTSPIPADLGCL